MPKFEIDSDVEMARKGRQAKWQRFPFSQLNVGNSFHIKLTELASEHGTLTAGAKATSILAIQAGKRLERRFAVRTVTDQDPRGPGVRVWRLEDAAAKEEGLDGLFQPETAPVPPEAPAPVQAKKDAPRKPGRPKKAAPVPTPTPPATRRRHARAEAQAGA